MLCAGVVSAFSCEVGDQFVCGVVSLSKNLNPVVEARKFKHLRLGCVVLLVLPFHKLPFHRLVHFRKYVERRLEFRNMFVHEWLNLRL